MVRQRHIVHCNASLPGVELYGRTMKAPQRPREKRQYPPWFNVYSHVRILSKNKARFQGNVSVPGVARLHAGSPTEMKA